MSPGPSRTTAFTRNVVLETLLRELNNDLAPAESLLTSTRETPAFPVLFVMGPLRSGTTLFMQWLANTGLFAYPTNLLSRFYGAPVLGAKIQLLLTDPRFAFRNELGEFAQQAAYTSENGKTQGVLAPNEFWYFWRRFLADPGRDVWTDDELRETMDTGTMLSELAGVMRVFEKPFAAKGMLFNYNIPFLDSLFEKVVFVQLVRDPVTNVASILDARRRQLGDEAAWYSFRIPEYQQLQGLDPVTQAAGQVMYINRAVTYGLERVADARKLVVSYEAFCDDPRTTFEGLMERLGMPEARYEGPQSFVKTRSGDLSNTTEIAAALSRLHDK